MCAAMVITSLTIAAFSFIIKAILEKLDVESDPIDRHRYETETRRLGWNLSNRRPRR